MARYNNKKGLSLVEILIASSILILATTAFLPVFSFVTRANNQNKERLTASILASNVIEEIRAMDYEDVGTIGGNPEGVVPQEQKKIIDGIEYTIKTLITWSSAIGKDGRLNETAFKRVKVIVEAPSAFSGNIEKLDEVHSIVAREGEEPIYKAGGIRVIIKNAKNEPYIGEFFTINITSEPNPPIADNEYTVTTDEGEVYFGIIPAGNYKVKVKIPDGLTTATHGEIIEDGWVIRRNVNVVDWQITEVIIYMEREENLCSLYLNMVDEKTGELIIAGGFLTLTWTIDGRNVTVLDRKAFTVDDLSDVVTDDGIHYSSLSAEFFGKLWPFGKYSIKIENIPYYRTFDMASYGHVKTQYEESWDGAFSEIGQVFYASAYIKPIYLFYCEEYIELERKNSNIINITAENIIMVNPAGIGAEYAFDNDDSTSWDIVRGDKGSDKIEAVIVDLKSGERIDKIVIKLSADYKFHFTLWGDNNLGDNKLDGNNWNIKADTIYHEENIVPQDGIYELTLDPYGLTDSYRYYIFEIKLTQKNSASIVNIFEIDLYGDGGAEYVSPREELNGPIDLSRFSPAPHLTIDWEADIPTGTKYEVFTAITNSQDEQPSYWIKATKDQGIPGIYEGQDLTGKYLWIKEVFTTDNTAITPIRYWLRIEYIEEGTF